MGDWSQTVCASINLIKNFNHILLLQNTSWANETKLLMPITFAEQRKLNKTHGELRAARGEGEWWEEGNVGRTTDVEHISKIILNICTWHVGPEHLAPRPFDCLSVRSVRLSGLGHKENFECWKFCMLSVKMSDACATARQGQLRYDTILNEIYNNDRRHECQMLRIRHVCQRFP